MQELCDIIIPVWNLKETTERCIESIITHTRYPYRLVMIDNGSDEPTKTYLEQLKNDTRINQYHCIRNEKNLGAAPAYNQGMKASYAPYILLLNNDTVVTERWLSEMISVAELANDIGIVNPDSNNLGTTIPKGASLDEFAQKHMSEYKGRSIEMAEAVGFCYLMKREVLDRIGVWSEEYGFGNYEETEHCILARKEGIRIMLAQGAFVFHEEHATFNTLFKKRSSFEEIFENDKKKFEEKYGKNKRVLYVVTTTDRKVLKKIDTATYTTAAGGTWVHVIVKDATRDYVFERKHRWITFFTYSPHFFIVRCFLKIYFKKKRYDEIYVDSNALYAVFKRYALFLRAKIILFEQSE
ncbi:MAG: glycosyltransferase family 2 protein [Candidatus Omnitrophica bacterium]|nr:glycosyltransferase family 2 protein [Candidatus Omnitrophota bacterium]